MSITAQHSDTNIRLQVAPPGSGHHLSQIQTAWTVIRNAHRSSDTLRRDACRALLDRYGDAVLRYLRKSVGERAAADELYQEFALRLLTGRFCRASPGCGRFRDYIKTALFHLVRDHYRRLGRREAVAIREELVEDPRAGGEDAFASSWRDSLLARTWERLAAHETRTGQPHHSVLRLRVDFPDFDSTQLAAAVSERLGRSIREGALRVALHRARRRFAQLLVEDVADSLQQPSAEQIEQELIALRLLRYCRPALRDLA